jgi:hypothetical protein
LLLVLEYTRPTGGLLARPLALVVEALSTIPLAARAELGLWLRSGDFVAGDERPEVAQAQIPFFFVACTARAGCVCDARLRSECRVRGQRFRTSIVPRVFQPGKPSVTDYE